MTKPRTKPRALPRIRPMTPGIPHAARVRAYLAGLVVTAGLCGVAWRAWALQVGDGDHYRALAVKQHALTVRIPAPRGDIIDAHGRPLAVSAAADSIWANPREIRDVTDTADKLAKLLGSDAVTLEAKLAGDHRFVWLDRHVTPELARVVRDARLPGIEVGKEPRRWYPARATGGTVVGRSDIDGNGLDGVELAMNAQLIGHRGAGLGLRDARGKKMFAGGLEPPEAGATVQLSLDSTIQASAEAALGEAVRANKAKSGVAVVVEIASGRVVAMASSPSYDPNTPNAAGARNAGDGHGAPDAGNAADAPDAAGAGAAGDAARGAASDPAHAGSGGTSPGALRARDRGARNRAVTDAFEAGSVMKIFSVAAALDDGTVTPDTEFDLGGGQLKIGSSRPIHDVHVAPYLTVAGIIKHSSNVGAAKIALRFGAAKLYAALRRFGFGRRTGIELPGEQPGMLRDGARWRDIELATISYGYGLAVTPLQIAAALAAFGNHGLYREPRIVERVIDADGTLLYEAAPAVRQVVSDRTAAAMLAMLASTFEGGKQAGTAAMIVVPGFRCGGKTGTARKYDPATKQYALDRYLSSFAGIAPIDHPRLAIVVIIDDPSGGDYYGGQVAGPVFAAIASEALRYLGVPGASPICAPPVPGAPPSTAAKICLPAAAVASGRPGPGSLASAVVPSGPPAAAVAPGKPGPSRLASAVVPSGPPAAAVAPGRPGPSRLASAVVPSGRPGFEPVGEPGLEPVGEPGGEPGLEPAAQPAAQIDAEDEPAEDQPPVAIPDFRGLGMARAIALAREAHVRIEVSGTGRVIRQAPAPGPSQNRPDRLGRSISIRNAARIGSFAQGGDPWMGPLRALRDRSMPVHSAPPIGDTVPAEAPGSGGAPRHPRAPRRAPRVVLQFSDGKP